MSILILTALMLTVSFADYYPFMFQDQGGKQVIRSMQFDDKRDFVYVCGYTESNKGFAEKKEASTSY